MASILFTSISSVRAHHRLGNVRWDLTRRLAPGIVLGGLLAGAGAFSVLKGQGLALFFAAFIGYMAVNMLRDKKPKPGRDMPGALGLLAEADGMILLRLAADEAEILTFAVRPAARRTGMGRALLETGMVLLAAQGARTLLLEVAEGNEAALALYTEAGFTRAATRRDYYAPGQHALLLRRDPL
jgi:ribosomal protein S18 acetylase RimI-like enzyme